MGLFKTTIVERTTNGMCHERVVTSQNGAFERLNSFKQCRFAKQYPGRVTMTFPVHFMPVIAVK